MIDESIIDSDLRFFFISSSRKIDFQYSDGRRLSQSVSQYDYQKRPKRNRDIEKSESQDTKISGFTNMFKFPTTGSILAIKKQNNINMKSDSIFIDPNPNSTMKNNIKHKIHKTERISIEEPECIINTNISYHIKTPTTTTTNNDGANQSCDCNWYATIVQDISDIFEEKLKPLKQQINDLINYHHPPRVEEIQPSSNPVVEQISTIQDDVLDLSKTGTTYIN